MPLPDLLGYAAAVLTTVSFVPQAHRTWKTRCARDVSLGMLSLFSLGVALWLCYGVVLGARPVVAANAATLALALFILAMKLRFDRSSRQPRDEAADIPLTAPLTPSPSPSGGEGKRNGENGRQLVSPIFRKP